MQTLLNYVAPLPSVESYRCLFASIAEAYLNHTVLAVRPSGSSSSEAATKYFRVGEIEFYLNDYGVHKDTFTHGDTLQK